MFLRKSSALLCSSKNFVSVNSILFVLASTLTVRYLVSAASLSSNIGLTSVN